MIKPNPEKRFRSLLKKAGIPKYNSKFSKRKFGNYKLLFLLVVKTSNSLSYRRTETHLRQFITKKNTPDHTTLQKFLKRIPEEWILLAIEAFKKCQNFVAIDGTGIRQKFSEYYRFVCGRITKRRDFLKLTIAVNEQGWILSYCASRSEQKSFLYLLDRLSKAKIAVADKLHDCVKNFDYCSERRIKAYIPIKENAKKAPRSLLLRNRKFTDFDKVYPRRNIVESVNHAFKTKYGDEVFSRKLDMQQKEAGLKILTYNFEKSESGDWCLFRISTEPISIKICDRMWDFACQRL
jgi:hypothetical protein